jgi:hypothetical protein
MRRRYPNPVNVLNEAEQEQKRSAQGMRLHAEVLCRGVGAIIAEDTLTVREMAEMAELLSEAAKLAKRAEASLNAIEEIADQRIAALEAAESNPPARQ